jgi:nucleotide-binding universal stress UspA family protein
MSDIASTEIDKSPDPSAADVQAPQKAVGWRGRKFLVVADHSEESRIAAYYAAHRAKATSAHVMILSVIEPADFQHWAAVGERMRAEALQDAEALLYEAAGVVNDVTGDLPEWVIREGKVVDEVKSLIAEEKDIRILVVGAAVGKDGPGPLVARIASDWGGFPVPVVIIPGELTVEEIKSLV